MSHSTPRLIFHDTGILPDLEIYREQFRRGDEIEKA